MLSKELANPNNSMDIPITNVSSLPIFFIQICSLSENGCPFSHRALPLHISPFKHQGKKNNSHHKVHSLHRPLEGMCPIWCPTGAVRAVHHTPHDDECHRSAHNKGEESAQQHEKITSFLLLWCYVWQTNFVPTSSLSLSSSEEHSQSTRQLNKVPTSKR